jgi:hypothetical protein
LCSAFYPITGFAPKVSKNVICTKSHAVASKVGDGKSDGGNQDDELPPRKWWHWRGLPALAIASIVTSLCGASALYFPIIPVPICYAVVCGYAIFLLIRGTVGLWEEFANTLQNKSDNKGNNRPNSNSLPKCLQGDKPQSVKYQSQSKTKSTQDFNDSADNVEPPFHNAPPQGGKL